MKILTGVHCNHRMVSALSFICMCVFVIVYVLVFVLAYTARKTSLVNGIISTFKVICILEKIISYIFVFKKAAVTPCNETT